MRAGRGCDAVDLHPDRRALDDATCAADIVADILHACVIIYGVSDPEEILERAMRTYQGDKADA